MNFYNVSASALKQLPVFGSCSRKLWYNLHSHTKKNATDENSKNIGIFTHAVLEKYLFSLHYGTFFDFRQTVASISDKINYSMPDGWLSTVKTYFERAQIMLKSFQDFKLFVEPEFRMIFPYLSKNGNLYNLKGIADLVFTYTEEGNTRLAIGDWKSGKLEYENELGAPQFTLYNFLWRKLYGYHEHIPLSKRIVIFGLQDDELRIINVDKNYSNETENHIEAYIKCMENDNIVDYPIKKSVLCNHWCEYSGDCQGIVRGKNT